MTGNTMLYRRLSRSSSSIMLFVILVSLLVGCDSKTTHTFAGHLNIISLPQPYLIPETIVLGADGTMWFPAIAYSNFGTTRPSGAIGKLTPSGKITLFPLPTNSFPRYITEGSDGNFWFTETLSQGYVTTIARMTPSGKITGEFSLPSTTESAEDMISGPDGNLWFIIASSIGQDAHAKVGRITPQGKITVFDLPASIFDAGDIINGPDGSLWFSVGRDIVRMTTDGHIKEFPLPTIAGKDQYNQPDASNVAAGPDGALWFLVYPQHSVGRMTTDGTIQQYSYPASTQFPILSVGSLITDIFGMDGTLWFTNGTQLGHFV